MTDHYILYFIFKDSLVVTVGNAICPVSSVTDTQLTCNLGMSSAGSFPVMVHLIGKGDSNNNVNFIYDLTITQLSNTQGYLK